MPEDTQTELNATNYPSEIDGQPVKMLYNVELGELVPYTLEVDQNNEIVARSTKNGDFLKFPNISEEEVDELVEKHNEQATRQVKVKPLFGGQDEPSEEVEPVVS